MTALRNCVDCEFHIMIAASIRVSFARACISIIIPHWLNWKRQFSQYVPKFSKRVNSSYYCLTVFWVPVAFLVHKLALGLKRQCRTLLVPYHSLVRLTRFVELRCPCALAFYEMTYMTLYLTCYETRLHRDHSVTSECALSTALLTSCSSTTLLRNVNCPPIFVQLSSGCGRMWFSYWSPRGVLECRGWKGWCPRSTAFYRVLPSAA
jgi:hypothetical protein